MLEIVRRARGTQPVRLLATLVVVLGILGMHSLAHSGPSHPPTAADAASALTQHMPDGTDAHAAPMRSSDATQPGRSFGSGPEHTLGDMVMLCTAMLAAAGTVLGLLWSIRRNPRLWALVAPPVSYVRPSRWLARVDTGPPAAWQFSVIRC